MALLSYVESAPRSLSAQGGQRRFSYFNIVRDNSALLPLHKTSRFGDVLLNTAKVIFEAHSTPRDLVGQ